MVHRWEKLNQDFPIIASNSRKDILCFENLHFFLPQPRFLNKKAGLSFFRQPGYLLKTRGFPSPLHGRFGFFCIVLISMMVKSVKLFLGIFKKFMVITKSSATGLVG
jgi:hypothetical protein